MAAGVVVPVVDDGEFAEEDFEPLVDEDSVLPEVPLSELDLSELDLSEPDLSDEPRSVEPLSAVLLVRLSVR